MYVTPCLQYWFVSNFRTDIEANNESDTDVISPISKSDFIARAAKETRSFEEFTKVIADEADNINKNSISKVR